MNSYDVRTAVVRTLVIAARVVSFEEDFDDMVRLVSEDRYPKSLHWRAKFVAEVYEEVARGGH